MLHAFVRVAILCLFLAAVAAAQPGAFRRNTLGIGWGYNYWGNTLSISYEHRISDKWSARIGFSRGLFDYIHESGEKMFFITNDHPYDLFIDIHIRRFLDFMLYYNRDIRPGFCFFNKFGYGLSQYFVQFEESLFMNEDKFTGIRDLTSVAFVVAANLAEYRPRYADMLSLSLGITVHVSILDSPQEMVIYYDGIPYYLYMTSTYGFHPFMYPQAYLKFGFSF